MTVDASTAALAKDRAEGLFSKGRYREALEAYEKIKPYGGKDPRIHLRMGDIARKLDDTGAALRHYKDASESFIKLGFIVKAVAVCKMIINMDPAQEDVERRLAELHGANPGTSGRGAAGQEKDAIRLPRTPLFSDFGEDEFLEAVRKVKSRELEAGSYLFHEGDSGDSIYVIAEGAVEVTGRARDSSLVKVAELGEGSVFGEFGFFLNSRRTTGVKAVMKSIVLELTKADLKEIIKKHRRVEAVLFDFYKERVVDKLMALSDVFGLMSASDRKEILARVTLARFDKGATIVREGEKGDTMYLIKEGKVAVSVRGKDGGDLTVTGLEEGDFFGEIALATSRPRFATVEALTPMELVVFSRPMIKDILLRYPRIKGVLEKVIKERVIDIVRAREIQPAQLI